MLNVKRLGACNTQPLLNSVAWNREQTGYNCVYYLYYNNTCQEKKRREKSWEIVRKRLCTKSNYWKLKIERRRFSVEMLSPFKLPRRLRRREFEKAVRSINSDGVEPSTLTAKTLSRWVIQFYWPLFSNSRTRPSKRTGKKFWLYHKRKSLKTQASCDFEETARNRSRSPMNKTSSLFLRYQLPK